MKKFKFTLSTVLSYKQQVLSALQGEHGAMIAQVREQEEKIENLHREYEAMAREYREKCHTGMDIRQAMGYQARLRARERELEQEEIALLSLRKKEEAKRKEVVAAKLDTSSLEKLREKKKAEYDAAAAKQEEQFIEEFVSSRMVAADQQENG